VLSLEVGHEEVGPVFFRYFCRSIWSWSMEAYLLTSSGSSRRIDVTNWVAELYGVGTADSFLWRQMNRAEKEGAGAVNTKKICINFTEHV
jgi:hypothetical protein